MLVVGHQMIFSGLSCRLSGDPPTHWQTHTLSNGGWMELRIGSGPWSIGARGGGAAPELDGL